MTNNDIAGLADLWTSIKDYIPTKDRVLAAEHFLESIEENELCDLEENASELAGFCSTLDRALVAYTDNDEDSYEEY